MRSPIRLSGSVVVGGGLAFWVGFPQFFQIWNFVVNTLTYSWPTDLDLSNRQSAKRNLLGVGVERRVRKSHGTLDARWSRLRRARLSRVLRWVCFACAHSYWLAVWLPNPSAESIIGVV